MLWIDWNCERVCGANGVVDIVPGGKIASALVGLGPSMGAFGAGLDFGLRPT